MKVLEPLASAEACLTPDEKEMGCCILDIGGGTTDLAVFGGGVVRHTGTIAIGGDHFTNDLAVGLRTPIPEAEKDHIATQKAPPAEILHHDGAIEIASVGDRPLRTISFWPATLQSYRAARTRVAGDDYDDPAVREWNARSKRDSC